MKVALKPTAPIRGEELFEQLRTELLKALPSCQFTFEAGDIVSRL